MRLSRKATLVFNRNWYSIALYWNHCKTYEYTIQADLYKTIPMICFPKWKYQCENQVLVLFSTFVYRLPKEISTNSRRFESSLFRKFRRKTPVPHLFLIKFKKKKDFDTSGFLWKHAKFFAEHIWWLLLLGPNTFSHYFAMPQKMLCRPVLNHTETRRGIFHWFLCEEKTRLSLHFLRNVARKKIQTMFFFWFTQTGHKWITLDFS